MNKGENMKKIYLAGGWFTPEQDEQHTRIYNLIKHKYDVFNPRKEGEITKGITTNDKMSKILIGNIEAIKDADLTIVLYDYRDTGTIWEAGFSYSSKKPIIYFAEHLNGKPFNLMLAKTGRFASNEKELIELLDDASSWLFKDVYDDFTGEIE